MISADHITFDGDTAWTVVLSEMAFIDYTGADRPCDTCADDYRKMITRETHDCIDGRHTFEVEVACWRHSVCQRMLTTYRVSIVPGMVLPIVNTLPESGYQVEGQRAVFNDPAWPGESFIRNVRGDIDGIAALPPAAKPGMWAVKLNVQPKEQQ